MFSSKRFHPSINEIVTFTAEEFDFGNEYDGSTTFIPNQDGVYSIVATVLFVANNTPFSVAFDLLVNGFIVDSAVNLKLAVRLEEVSRNRDDKTYSY